jgi:hypothetical protein
MSIATDAVSSQQGRRASGVVSQPGERDALGRAIDISIRNVEDCRIRGAACRERERNAPCKVDHRQSFLERCTLDSLDIDNRSQLFVEQSGIGSLRHYERSFHRPGSIRRRHQGFSRYGWLRHAA